MTRAMVILLVLAGCSAGHAGSPCARTSDCQIGLVCSALGSCAEAPVDAAAGDAGSDASTIDASRIPPGLDADVDAPIDAPVDAAVDAPAD
jgi:hypothetical protein